MRTFYVEADVNKLLDQVGLSDDWMGAMIDAFVIDYVFDRPSVIAQTMEELAPPACKVCGDSYSAHQHYRSGSECAQCSCPRYRARTTRTERLHYRSPSRPKTPDAAGAVWAASLIVGLWLLIAWLIWTFA